MSTWSLEEADHVARSVLDSLLEGCQVIGFDFRYRYVNDTVARHGQRAPAELVGRTMMECYPGIEHTPMFARLRSCMTERRRDRMENEFQLPDGSKRWFELRFIPVPDGICVLSLDITDEREAREQVRRIEAQLRHAQKMEAVGRLAGGVAHDFNNILSVILSYSDFLLSDVSPSDPIAADLDEIQKAGKRGAELTRQLLTFSRQQILEPLPVALDDLLHGIHKMIARLLGADIDLEVRTKPGLGKILVDPGAIEQVIMNLVVNARDAMPRGGKLTIEAAPVTLDEAYAREHLGVHAGPHVMLAVTDTGCGMDAATRDRIFEPFFTTKGTGKGTGLGLSIVFGIVQQAGGSIWVYSEPSHGTTFKLYFPLAAGRAESARPTEPARELRGSETILLVEDDPQVRSVVREILERAGYTVLEAESPEDALAIADRHARIDLLLSDVVMPRMSGPELAKRLAERRPEVRLLCMSGYTDDSIVRHGVLDAAIAYLQKPITPEVLTRKVREVLDARSPDL
ncbi:MAG TPA: ATP-binding protein [Kofleriaceae bacterium]|nr:ATP-binding protein [Kofleriaceae bacterium]